MTCTVDVGEAFALASHIGELRTILEAIDRKAFSVDLRGPQQRVSCWRIGGTLCSIDASREKAGTRHVLGSWHRIFSEQRGIVLNRRFIRMVAPLRCHELRELARSRADLPPFPVSM